MAVDQTSGKITVTAGTDDDDYGFHVQVVGKAYPTVSITPAGVLTGSGTAAPTPGEGGADAELILIPADTTPTLDDAFPPVTNSLNEKLGFFDDIVLAISGQLYGVTGPAVAAAAAAAAAAQSTADDATTAAAAATAAASAAQSTANTANGKADTALAALAVTAVVPSGAATAPTENGNAHTLIIPAVNVSVELTVADTSDYSVTFANPGAGKYARYQLLVDMNAATNTVNFHPAGISGPLSGAVAGMAIGTEKIFEITVLGNAVDASITVLTGQGIGAVV